VNCSGPVPAGFARLRGPLNGDVRFHKQGPCSSTSLRCQIKHILEKRNGIWRIISAQNTFISSA